MITVAIIEDNRLVREGMTDMLNELPDVKVVLAATSVETAMLRETNPRVVLLDVGLQRQELPAPCLLPIRVICEGNGVH